ncbi:hypothetical protein PALU110988_19970 [Paenibacillus lupini]|uniref:hypothetical protein n=1 Tax=Paenibacillus lupini TaxID=1450204 RepID=UPI001424855F|nr:hypothetical protein [Paenibacillus lupini]NIK21924.1 hypothetical protein [Paenibacillus lupini]
MLFKIFAVAAATLIAAVVDNHSDIKKLKDLTAFNIYIPTRYETALHYEVKFPEPDHKENVEYILVNYFDAKDDYVFGVHEQKNNTFVTKEIHEVDGSSGNLTIRREKYYYSYKPRPNSELVSINGENGWYEAYINRTGRGGKLTWIDSGTCIELDTVYLSKNNMIKIAESMKKL